MKKSRAVPGLISAAIVVFVLFFASQQPILHSESDDASVKKAATLKESNNSFITKKEKIELKHEQIISLTDQFMEELVQDTDEWYKVINYQSKEAFIEDFTQLASKSVAEKYINAYYIQEEDGLYVIPTSTPPWFVNDQEYQVKKNDTYTFTVTQQNLSELHGDYTIELEFTFDGNWKITETTYF